MTFPALITYFNDQADNSFTLADNFSRLILNITEDEIYRCLISKWVAVTWLKVKAPG